MRSGDAMLVDFNVHFCRATAGTMLAEIEAQSGRPEAGLATLDTASATLNRTGERRFESEVNRVRGELLTKHWRDRGTTAGGLQSHR